MAKNGRRKTHTKTGYNHFLMETIQALVNKLAGRSIQTCSNQKLKAGRKIGLKLTLQCSTNDQK